MASQYQSYDGDTLKGPNLESAWSGVSWGAILAGGVAAAALSLILLTLGSGLGFASISPWAADSTSATGLAVAAGIWIIVVQWLASLVGGYVAGRLRTKWADHHSDEVFFRDTAHGMLAWGVATLFAVGLSIFAGMAAVGAVAAGTGAAVSAAADAADADAYSLDQLFRAAPAPATQPAATAETTGPDTGADENVRSESGRILQRAVLGTGEDADQAYLAQLVAGETGLSQADAEQRVNEVITSAKEAADTARQASAYAAIITALSLLVGAFIAAVAGAIGGRYRDELSKAST